ncbi:keratin-associated protein 16-1-like isoform X2 [Plodia interpunctella]|nr:keratin-associated protein 16-1-like isoform X2 [Plodia interpunctella]XP_053623444.1 keratin-associated protein 16-1-like isoform X2 [Plodia interpunctella]XP_053623446.1 keratin-associated protein 16-1-like isoform X2 [Plodia interpunctella]
MVKVAEPLLDKPGTFRKTYNLYKSMSCPAFAYLDLQLDIVENLPKSQSTSNIDCSKYINYCQNLGCGQGHVCPTNNRPACNLSSMDKPKAFSTNCNKNIQRTIPKNDAALVATRERSSNAASSKSDGVDTVSKEDGSKAAISENNGSNVTRKGENGINPQFEHAAMACMPICCQPFHNPLSHAAAAWHPQENNNPCNFSAPCHPNWEGALHVGAAMNPFNPASICQPLYCPAVSCNPLNSPKTFADPIAQMCNVCGCPCPCPCGAPGQSPCPCLGGSCLPPPCNVPAKCLQNMTGYYYYPYGTWFCGPYHVKTAPTPCCGPVSPGGPCGPNPPNPGGPCGPCGIGPCGPCGPCCGPCGPCGPCCGPCGPCGCVPPFGCGPCCCGPCGPCGCVPCGGCPFFGPCTNCPCGPIPCGPVSPDGPIDPSKLAPPPSCAVPAAATTAKKANIDAVDCFCKASLAARAQDNKLKTEDEKPAKAPNTTPIYSNPNIIKGFPYNKIKPLPPIPMPNASVGARASATCFSTLISAKSISLDLKNTRNHTTKIRNVRKPHYIPVVKNKDAFS